MAYNSLYFNDLIDNNYFSHTFVGAACNSNSQDSSVYTVQKELYNILDCSNYSVNGGGLTTDVSTSEPPVAAISHDDQFCLDPSNQNSLIILNETIPGQYSSGDDCLNDAVYTWQYQTPASSVWITISSFLPAYQWISDYNGDSLSDLVIPYSALDGSPGCWNFRLEAVNGNGLQCEFSDLAEGTVEVLQLPDVNFNIQDINGNTVEEICPSGSVTLLNLTDMSDLLCQDLNYEWEINPINPPDLVNYISYTDSTNSFSENPIVVFNEPGEYEITLTVTNGNCEPQTFTRPFTVTGTPGVTLGVNTDNEEVCVQNISLQNSYVVDFSQNFTPQYTSEPFAPSSYLWEISGDNITSNDYSFINGTDSESPFPIIEFYSFECYNISISVDSTCATSSNDSFVLSITGIPDVNFQFQNETGDVVSQACPGQTIDFTNLTSFEGSGCQDIVYTWIINGTNQYIYQNGNNNSQTPSVSFNDPGIYEVSLLVNNGICATDIITQSITIEGPPSVDINVNGSDSDQICLLNSNLPYTIDFSSTYIPSYSDGIFSPNSYLWEISGDGVTAADYTFINSSDSPFPVIQFNSFKDFNITSTVEGNCQVSSSDQFVLALNQIPEITDLNISQTVCSGESTEEIIFQSNVDETDYSWTLINGDTYLSGYDQQGTGNFSIQNIINSNDISGQIEFSVTPLKTWSNCNS